MATSSIFHDFIVTKKESVDKIVEAIENNKPQTERTVSSRTATKEEAVKLLMKCVGVN